MEGELVSSFLDFSLGIQDMIHPCQSDNQTLFKNYCFAININRHVPLKLGLPLYGYVMPFIVALTVATNSFIVIVLSHRYLRTPTNYVLLAMAVTELLTGISSTPWLVYYYTLQGYTTDMRQGLSDFWCRSFPYFSTIMPTVFHTSAIWLTCYLAIQRYVYVCLNRSTTRQSCGFRRTKFIIAIICTAALISTAPSAFATYNRSFEAHPNATWAKGPNGLRRFCVRLPSKWMYKLGMARFYHMIFWFQAICVYTLPCILLVVFTALLLRLINNRQRRQKQLRNFARHFKAPRENGEKKKKGRCSKGLKQNTRMLIVIIAIFLATEVPAAVIFVLHVLTVTQHLKLGRAHYMWMNTAVLLRNVLIVISYPFRFAIYCGMSHQFRMVARQLFSSKETVVVGSRASDGMSSEAVTMPPNQQRQRSYTLVLVSVDNTKPQTQWKKLNSARRGSGYGVTSCSSTSSRSSAQPQLESSLKFDSQIDTRL